MLLRKGRPSPARTAARRSRSWAWRTSPSTSPTGPAPPAPGWAPSIRPTSSAWSTSKRASRRAPWPAGNAVYIELQHRHPAGCRGALRVRLRPLAAGQGLHPAAARPAVLRRGQPALSPPLPQRSSRPPPSARGASKASPPISCAATPSTSTAFHEADYRDKMEEFLVTQTCPDCDGTRLRPESRAGDRQRADHHRRLAPAARRSRRLAGGAARRLSARMKCSSPNRSWSI